LALGPWPLALGPWPLALGPWPLALGPWPLALGPGASTPRSIAKLIYVVDSQHLAIFDKRPQSFLLPVTFAPLWRVGCWEAAVCGRN